MYRSTWLPRTTMRTRMIDPRRTLALALRRQIKVKTRQTVKYLGEGWFEYTCKTCGCVMKGQHTTPDGRRADGGDAMAKRWVKYVMSGGGVSGTCKRCTKARRDRDHPLPKKN